MFLLPIFMLGHSRFRFRNLKNANHVCFRDVLQTAVY